MPLRDSLPLPGLSRVLLPGWCMQRLFSDPRRVLRLSWGLLCMGVLLLASGLAVAYGLERRLAIPALVGAHVLIVLGPTLFKLGYVMRLAAQQKLQPQVSAVPLGRRD